MNRPNYHHQQVTRLNNQKTQEKYLKKKESNGNSKGATRFETQYIKSNVFCPFSAMTSHPRKWRQSENRSYSEK